MALTMEHELLEHDWSRFLQNMTTQSCRRYTFPACGMVACSSGTAALHLALESLNLPPGSRVIVPDYCMIACARAVTLAGHVPVLVDVKSDYLINTDLILNVCNNWPNVRAVMAVHTYGHICDMDSIHEIANSRNLMVIEDMAEAHCSPPSIHSDAACWSFYRNKVVHGEEGGMLYLPVERMANKARSLRSLGMTPGGNNYYHLARGHNYRLANSLAALVRKSLAHFPQEVQRRRNLEGVYDSIIGNLPVDIVRESTATPWVYVIWLHMTSLQQQTICNEVVKRTLCHDLIRPGFYPLHLQPEYMTCDRWLNGTSDICARKTIYLSLGEHMSNNIHEIIGQVVTVIKEVLDL